MKIENGSVVMDAGVQRSTYFKRRRIYFIRHVCTVTVCLVMEKDGFCIH